MSRDERIWLVDSKRSAAGYWLVYGLGILQLFGAGALVFQGGQAGYALALILGLSAALFLCVARTMGAGKGGVAYLPSGNKLVMYGTGGDDTLDIPVLEGDGFAVRRRKEFWGREAEPVLVSSVEFVSGGVSYLLFEPRTLDDALEAALTFRTATGLPMLPDDDEVAEGDARGAKKKRGAGRNAPESFLLRRGPTHALWGPTLLLALFSLTTGGLLLASVKSTGVVGFLFGPFLAAVGACCLALWVVRSFGIEKLTLFDDGIEQQVALGSRRIMRRTLTPEAPGAYARVRTQGALGFRLEFVAGSQVLVAGTGSSRRGALKPRRLVEIAVAFGKAVPKG